MEIELWILVVLFLVAIFAGGVDAIAGGGGLIVLPALLLTGMSPVNALATNKFQGMFGSGSACYAFWRAGHIEFRKWAGVAVMCAAMSALGAVLVASLPSDALMFVVPVLLISLALYFLLQRDLDGRRAAILPLAVIAWIAVPLVGFYDGFFGPGAGSFYMAAFVGLGGLGIIQATAQTKLVNFASNFGGFLLFAGLGVVEWKIGLVMGAGQLIGGQIGARLAVLKGSKLIRPLLVMMSTAMALNLLFNR